MTSAPMSASRHVANGPESTCSNARILTPSSARLGLRSAATVTSSLQTHGTFGTIGTSETRSVPIVPVVPAVPWCSLRLLFDRRKKVLLRRVRFLPHHHAARIIDHNFTLLLDAAGANLDDAPLRLR